MSTYTKWPCRSSHRVGVWAQAFLLACTVLLVGCTVATGEDFAQPPVWSDEVKSVFFDDARKALVGSPPVAQAEAEAATAKSSHVNWQQFVEAETLSTEVKRIVNNLAALTKNPTQFQAAKHNDVRRELTMLAALFGVIREYPDDVRWQASAGAMEQRCLQAAESCTVGSVESLAAVQETHALLEELLRGQAVETSDNQVETAFPDFAPLMQRMELALKENLPVLLTKDREFRKRAIDVAHEAQLLAMLSQVIRGEAYGYSDDETYQSHVNALRDTANQLKAAASSQDFAKAVQAAAAVSKSCANCHADFRG